MAKASKQEIKGGEVGSASEYRPKSDADIKQLALDVIAGQVFGSWMLPEHDLGLIGNIFMVMLFVDDIERKRMHRDEITHVYEHMHKAGPRSINGYPIFMSAQFLNPADATRLSEKMKQIQAALDAI